MKDRKKSHLLTQRETSEKCVEMYLEKAGVKWKYDKHPDLLFSQYIITQPDTKHVVSVRRSIVSCFDDGRIELSFLDIDDDVRTPRPPIQVGLTMGELECMANTAKEFVK